jgi:serine/threonine-protein kinase
MIDDFHHRASHSASEPSTVSRETACRSGPSSTKWLILEFIAKGCMGEVYRARQVNLKRDVGIKVVSQEWLESLDGDADEIEGALERFRNEVQAMAQIRHPNVVQIYDYGSASVQKGDEEVVVEYIVMEYIPGATLRFSKIDQLQVERDFLSKKLSL